MKEKHVHIVVIPSEFQHNLEVVRRRNKCGIVAFVIALSLLWSSMFMPDYCMMFDMTNSTNNTEVTDFFYVVGAPHASDFRNTTSVQKPSFAAEDIPEYTDRTLLEHMESLRAGFAKQMHVPSKARQHFIDSNAKRENAVAVLVGGDLEERDGTDTEILFRQESNFMYVTGFDHPGATVIVILSNIDKYVPGDALLFIEQGDAVWQGRTETLDDFKERYDITDAFWYSKEAVEQKLVALAPSTVYTLSGANVPIPEGCTHDSVTLRADLARARVIKTEGEIAMVKAAADVSVKAHKKIMEKIRCGVNEGDIESLFRYVCHNYGARFQAYIPIVGGGVNSAALHYNDNDQMISDGSVLLIDAGAETGGTRNGGGWATDITRTMPCSGRFSQEQRSIYDIVYEAQDSCVNMCVPGKSMYEATQETNRIITNGLLRVGILHNASVAELLEKRLYTTFLPHGLGHSVGIDVHDPGSISPFAAGMVVTCEPGIYFIESLLDKALNDATKAPYINAEVLSRFRGIGGYRLEDTILITETEPENLSADIPRTSTEIEEFMASGRNKQHHYDVKATN